MALSIGAVVDTEVISMGKKSTSKHGKAGKEPSGDLPYLLTLEEGKTHEIEIELDTFDDPVKDGGPDGIWSCYRVTIDDEEDCEVPFWAMAAFYEALPDTWDEGDTVTLKYRRKEKNGKNTASFQEA